MTALTRRQAVCMPWMWAAGAALARSEPPPMGKVLRVGPTRAVQTLAQAARMVSPGSTIEVDAGEYMGDVAVWLTDRLLVRAVGGRVKLRAAGAAVEGKGIWVVRANGMRVEGFDFEGAAVASRNGAGIRLDKGSLQVYDCSFRYNEMGLLTNNDPDTVLEVENSEFAYNQRPDGHNHNLYVGRIARLSITGSYLHHAHTGHLLKSRAAINQVLYNRLTDEAGGTASYELEFPDGGVAQVVGNIIEQGPDTENRHLIAYGAEGYKWLRNEILLSHNTLVNQVPQGGIYLRVAPGATAVRAVNNLLLGPGTLEAAGPGDYRNNLAAEPGDFVDAAARDYRLKPRSALIGRAIDAQPEHDLDPRPRREYLHPRQTRALSGPAHNPGAIQRPASSVTP